MLFLAVYRTATCCSDAAEVGRIAEQVQLEGYEMAQQLHRGEFDEAHQRLDDEARQELSVDEFSEQLAEFRPYFEAGEPYPVRVDFGIDGEDFGFSDIGSVDYFEVRTKFGDPRYEEVVELRLVSTPSSEKEEVDDEEIEELEIRFDEIDVMLVEKDFRESIYARTARQFVEILQRGDYEELQRMLPVLSDLGQLSEEELTSRFRSIADKLQQAEQSEVYGVFPHGIESVAVRVVMVDEQKEASFVDLGVDVAGQVQDVTDPQPVQLPLEELELDMELDLEDSAPDEVPQQDEAQPQQDDVEAEQDDAQPQQDDGDEQ